MQARGPLSLALLFGCTDSAPTPSMVPSPPPTEPLECPYYERLDIGSCEPEWEVIEGCVYDIDLGTRCRPFGGLSEGCGRVFGFNGCPSMGEAEAASLFWGRCWVGERPVVQAGFRTAWEVDDEQNVILDESAFLTYDEWTGQLQQVYLWRRDPNIYGSPKFCCRNGDEWEWWSREVRWGAWGLEERFEDCVSIR